MAIRVKKTILDANNVQKTYEIDVSHSDSAEFIRSSIVSEFESIKRRLSEIRNNKNKSALLLKARKIVQESMRVNKLAKLERLEKQITDLYSEADSLYYTYELDS